MTTNQTDDDDGVLTPDELHSQLDDERVDDLGENRYVVRSDSSPSETDSLLEGGVLSSENTHPRADLETDVVDHPRGDGGDDGDGHALEAAAEPHGIDVTLKTDGELAHLQTTSNDVREVFSEMLTWYADQLDDDCTPAEALQVMLATTNLEA